MNSISLSQNIAVKHGKIAMITVAAYTFYKITMAAIRAAGQRGASAPLLAVICGINCAEAAASVLTLQRSMLVSFGSMKMDQILGMNMATGVAVCLFVLLLGIFMMRRGAKKGE